MTTIGRRAFVTGAAGAGILPMEVFAMDEAAHALERRSVHA
jgi:hypothetical protein